MTSTFTTLFYPRENFLSFYLFILHYIQQEHLLHIVVPITLESSGYFSLFTCSIIYSISVSENLYYKNINTYCCFVLHIFTVAT